MSEAHQGPGARVALVVCPAVTGRASVAEAMSRWHATPGWAAVVPQSQWRAVDADLHLFVPADCWLAPEAHRAVHELALHNPAVDFAYFDSAEAEAGRIERPNQAHHRPAYSPDRLRAQHYIGPVFAVSRRLGDRVEPRGPLKHLDAIALAREAEQVAHIPQILYHVPAAEESGQRRPEQNTSGPGSVAVDDHQARLDAEGFPAVARPRTLPSGESMIDLKPSLADRPAVSIIMPTNGVVRDIDGRPTMLCLQAIDSIIAATTYAPYQIVVVITPGAPDDLAARVTSTVERHRPDRQPAITFCHDDRPFNFANACNRGSVAADGDVVVFCNDDTVVTTADWLDRLVMYATRPDTGAVGARLLFGDGRIQHTGIWTRGGHPTHRYERFPADHPGHLDSLSVPQNCLAVSGACLAVESAKFDAVGGFCPHFPSSYNDVDLCLKLADAGWRTVLDPSVVLVHYEASSRDPKIEDWELALLHERWRSVVNDDPFDNPNHLAPGSDEFPAPDPVITAHRQRAGLSAHLPRISPLPRLAPGVPDRRAPALTAPSTQLLIDGHIDRDIDVRESARADLIDADSTEAGPATKVLPWRR